MNFLAPFVAGEVDRTNPMTKMTKMTHVRSSLTTLRRFSPPRRVLFASPTVNGPTALGCVRFNDGEAFIALSELGAELKSSSLSFSTEK
jgi:hypothetical protein